MSNQRYDAAWIAGAQIYGGGGLGVLGSVIRATTATGLNGPGLLYADWDSSVDDSKEFRLLITTWPSGTLFVYEDGTFSYTGTSDTAAANRFADGVSYGVAGGTFTLGLTSVSADLSGAYSLRGVVQSDLSGAYSLRGVVQRDLSGAYAIQEDGFAVVSLSAAWQMRTEVHTDFAGAYDIAGLGGASGASVWAHVLSNGKTAEQTLLDAFEMSLALARIHGLVAGEPLRVGSTARSAGPIQQTISEAGGEVVVTRTA